jgi:hypothetical protein
MIEAIVLSHIKDALAPCCALLHSAIAGPFAEKPKHLAAAARDFFTSLPGDPALAPVDQWGRRQHVAPGVDVVVDLVRIAEAVDAELAKRLAEHLLAWPKTYSLDRALVPAVKRLLGGGTRQSGAAMISLHAACLAHLEARAAEPLEAPRDWSRASNIRCSCEHCAALSRFLSSTASETWTLKAADQVRRHVEAEIKAARADLDFRTERRGSILKALYHDMPDRVLAEGSGAVWTMQIQGKNTDGSTFTSSMFNYSGGMGARRTKSGPSATC